MEDAELDAAWEQLELLTEQRRTLSARWLDDQFAEHDVKIEAAKAAVARAKLKRRQSSFDVRPITIDQALGHVAITKRSRFPIAELEIGQSFAVPYGPIESSAMSSFSAYKRNHPGFDYQSKRMEDGSRRFWRTA